MDKNDIIKRLRETDHNRVKVVITDMDGVLRGKYMHKDKLLSALESGFGFCSVVFGWDMVDGDYEKDIKITGWHTGYGDFDADVALDSYRTIPWEGNVPFFLADFGGNAADSLAVCPRSLLKTVIGKAQDMGYMPQYAQEFEWFNYRETSESLQGKSHTDLAPLTPGMFGYSILRMSENQGYFTDLFDMLEGFGVPLEGLHTETGPGATEAAIRYSDILEAADRAVLFKTAVKEIGYRHGVRASFMAKPSQELPGCGGHIHQSLWDLQTGKNCFYDESREKNRSTIMEHFLAGQLHCLPEILPMFAPTVNSYKRLVIGAWAPVNKTWGHDNRTCSLRVLTNGEKSTRIEHRVVGSDVNPYLAMTACLASGLYGIQQELPLKIPETTANGYAVKKGLLPSNLWEAAQKMKRSKIAHTLFGDTFVDHFTKTRQWEWTQFMAAVTDWETKRYFEII
ncbi:MAG: glutamine synthetase [Bacteroidota bacterium]